MHKMYLFIIRNVLIEKTKCTGTTTKSLTSQPITYGLDAKKQTCLMPSILFVTVRIFS